MAQTAEAIAERITVTFREIEVKSDIDEALAEFARAGGAVTSSMHLIGTSRLLVSGKSPDPTKLRAKLGRGEFRDRFTWGSEIGRTLAQPVQAPKPDPDRDLPARREPTALEVDRAERAARAEKRQEGAPVADLAPKSKPSRKRTGKAPQPAATPRKGSEPTKATEEPATPPEPLPRKVEKEAAKEAAKGSKTIREAFIKSAKPEPARAPKDPSKAPLPPKPKAPPLGGLAMTLGLGRDPERAQRILGALDKRAAELGLERIPALRKILCDSLGIKE